MQTFSCVSLCWTFVINRITPMDDFPTQWPNYITTCQMPWHGQAASCCFGSWRGPVCCFWQTGWAQTGAQYWTPPPPASGAPQESSQTWVYLTGSWKDYWGYLLLTELNSRQFKHCWSRLWWLRLDKTNVNSDQQLAANKMENCFIWSGQRQYVLACWLISS